MIYGRLFYKNPVDRVFAAKPRRDRAPPTAYLSPLTVLPDLSAFLHWKIVLAQVLGCFQRFLGVPGAANVTLSRGAAAPGGRPGLEKIGGPRRVLTAPTRPFAELRSKNLVAPHQPAQRQPRKRWMPETVLISAAPRPQRRRPMWPCRAQSIARTPPASRRAVRSLTPRACRPRPRT